jgi:hypothetical protein
VKGKGGVMIEKNINMGIATNQTTQRIVEKHARTQFVTAWISCYKGVGDQFLQSFQVGLEIDPCEYKGVNLGCRT